MKSGDITLIVARCADEVPARRYTIPNRVAVSVVVAVAVFLVSVSLSSLHYYYMWMKARDHVALKTKVDQLRKQNETFRVSAKQLTDRLSSLEVSAQKLRILSGMDEEGLGGVGGPSGNSDPVLNLNERALLEHFSRLDRKSISLRDELRRLQEYYKDRSILLTSTPSIMPVRGYPSDRYGMRQDPFTNEADFHSGLDISAPRGNRIVATADGVVGFAGRQVGYGNLVTIEHRFGISTRYGHLARITVTAGQKVQKGDVIGYVGSTGRATGAHLHYEVRLNGQPLDPLRFFRDSE